VTSDKIKAKADQNILTADERGETFNSQPSTLNQLTTTDERGCKRIFNRRDPVSLFIILLTLDINYALH